MSETVVFCEGYDDRAFWAGLLLNRFKATRCDHADYPVYVDQQKDRSHYLYRTKSKLGVRVVQAQGKGKVLGLVKGRIDLVGPEKPLSAVIVSADDDRNDDGLVEVGRTHWTPSDIASSLVQKGIACHEADHGELLVADSTRVVLFYWAADDLPSPNLPQLQSLERLVCSAISEAYPDRPRAVLTWLSSRPDVPVGEKIDKPMAMSHFAGWFSKFSSDNFYEHIWSDPAIAEALEARMRKLDGWLSIESLIM